MPALLRSLARHAAPGICLFWAVACSQGGPVASVNGQSITEAELAAQVRVYLSVRPGASDSPETRRQVLDQLIKQQLLVQAARAAGLDQDPGLRSKVAERRSALRAELQSSIEGLQAQLAGLDQAVETKLLIDAYSQSRRPGITVTTKDLQAAYQLRAAREPLPPLNSIRDQMLEQVILDRRVEEARVKADVKVEMGSLR